MKNITIFNELRNELSKDSLYSELLNSDIPFSPNFEQYILDMYDLNKNVLISKRKKQYKEKYYSIIKNILKYE